MWVKKVFEFVLKKDKPEIFIKQRAKFIHYIVKAKNKSYCF